MRKNYNVIWLILILTLCFSVVQATSNLNKTDGQIKSQNDVIDFIDGFTGDATFSMNAEIITVDTLVVDSVFIFSGAISVGATTITGNATVSGTVQGEQLTSTDDATIADDLGVGGDLAVTGATTADSIYAASGITSAATITAEQLTSTDDATIAGDIAITGDATLDSLYAGSDVVAVALIQGEQLTSTDDLTVAGESTLSGGINYNYTVVADSVYTVIVSDYIIDISHTDTADTVHVTIPTALAVAGKRFEIWDTEFNAGTNNIIIGTEGAETVNEAVADTIAANGGKRLIWSDGTNWFSRE